MFHTESVCLAFITILILFYLHITRNFNYWKNKNVQYAKPIPLLGNIFKVLTFQRSIGQFLHELYNDTNLPFIGFFVFDKPFLLIRDPELIKKCLIKDFEHFNDRSILQNRKHDEMAANSFLFLKNPTWRSVRVTVTPAYATGKMKGMLPLILEASNDLLNYLNNTVVKTELIEMREVALKFTTDVITSCGFGLKADCFHHDKTPFREVSRLMFDTSVGRKISMASYVFAPILVKLFKMKFVDVNAAKFIDKIVRDTVDEREISKVYRGDIIDSLIQIRDQHHRGSDLLDDKMMAAQLAQFFMAGFETTGSTISFALYELSLNQDVQHRLRGEIKSVIRNYESLTYEAIQEMKYLDMTIKETLRKYPILSFLERLCTRSYQIPETHLLIEKGIPIYISLLGLHFDPDYFPNPEKFDPERFTVENKSSRPSSCYMPFGTGPRSCLGARIGLLIVKVGLIRILNEFKVTKCKTTEIPLRFDRASFMVTPVNGINLRFKKLQN